MSTIVKLIIGIVMNFLGTHTAAVSVTTADNEVIQCEQSIYQEMGSMKLNSIDDIKIEQIRIDS